MSRPLRIQYPDAWYHIMNRGRRSEQIFYDKNDYTMFVELLKEASVAWNIRVCAYCLMPNHYHLLVQTPDSNLSRSMRHLNGIYTQRFNKRHGCDGPLFRGRYKSILIDADSYLLQLVRYIHKNPTKAGIAGMNQYTWSSHKGYLSTSKKWDWIYKVYVFRHLSKNKKLWVKMYRRFMAFEEDEVLTRVLEGKKWPSVLGEKTFTDWIKGRYYHRKDNIEVPQSKELTPEPEEIISTVCDFYDIKPVELYKSKRGEFNEPRNVAIFLMRRLRRDSLKAIGAQFNMEKYSSVSSVIERLKIKMLKERKLRRKVSGLIDIVVKGQGQT